ncbi:hypothetical protein K2P47_03380 [Patescibacteria group bacterium]|nr:hypothetical protein [Patescibacteria group bacterium]
MAKTSVQSKKLLKDLTGQLKKLQDELVVTNKLEGKDEYISVKVKKDQARFERVKVDGAKDKTLGNFLIMIEITAKQTPVLIPLSIASSQKPTGFVYQIEGTGEGSVGNANVTVRGDGVTQITVGTLVFAKIPAGKTATFRIQTTIKGQPAKTYKIIITRINYKLTLQDARYQQYLKPIVSDRVKFSN